MIMQICKSFKFDSAHFLPYYKGKCNSLHGHSWVLQVTLSGYVNDNTGMIIDFKEFSSKIQEIIETYDHTCLNDFVFNPTCENILESLGEEILKVATELDVDLAKLRLYEGPDSYIEKMYSMITRRV